MATDQMAIVGDMFRSGFRLQRNWSWSMATAFFFGEVGAGLFFISLFFDFLPGLILGLGLTAIGKTAGHMMHLGQPMRAWRAIVKLDRSWVSRGLLAIILFTGFGILHILDLAGLTFGLLPEALALPVTVVAGAAAMVIMVYQGLAMSHSSAITLWSSGLMPVISFTYAIICGISVMIVLASDSVLAGRPSALASLQMIELGLVFYALVMLASLLHAASYGSKGGQQSVMLLLRGPYAKWFISLVIVVGLILPAAMIALSAGGPQMALLVAGLLLIGYYSFRILIFKAAVFDPTMSFAPRSRRF